MINSSLRSIAVIGLMYIVIIEASRLRSDNNERNSNKNNWEYELYTPNALRHGIQGPGVSPTNKVTVGSVTGQTIYQVDVSRGTFSTYVGQPEGEADDQAFGPDGTLVWTSLLSGLVRSRLTNGTIKVIATNFPVTPNGVAFDTNGDCYYSQFPGGDGGIYKVDPKGVIPQQRVYTAASALNGFDFSSTNEIYGPYPFRGQIVKINLRTQTETVVASGFVDIEAVRLSADKSILYALDTGASSIYSVNMRTGAKTLVVKISGLIYLDNFRVYGNSLLISDTTSNVLINYNLQTKKTTNVTPVSVFNLPMGISFQNNKIYVADFTAERVYDVRREKLTTIARSGVQPASAGASAVSVSYGIWNIEASSKYLALACFYDGKVQIRNINTNAVVVDKIMGGPANNISITAYGLGFSNDEKTLLIADMFTGLRVNTGSDFLTSRIISVGDNQVVGLAVSINKPNTVYVGTYSGTVYTVNYVTGVSTVLATGFNAPEGLAVASVGKRPSTDVVIVADVGSKSVIKVSPNGTKQTIATNLPIGLPGPATLPPPNTFTGVTVDDDSNVYITSDLSDALIKIEC